MEVLQSAALATAETATATVSSAARVSSLLWNRRMRASDEPQWGMGLGNIHLRRNTVTLLNFACGRK